MPMSQGMRAPKKYQDVQDILAGGIYVITTMNVQHFESLNNIVEYAMGVNVRERLPDSILAEAKQIIDVMSSGSNEDVLRFGGAQ